MQNNANTALNLIIQWEGPEVNISPAEPGGISKYGISLTTYTDYCKKNHLPVPTANTIADLTEQNARDFYSDTFLPAIRFNDLPNGVDVRAADITVNLGITGGVNLIQMVIQEWPLTDTLSNTNITTINSMSEKTFILALSTGWITKKHTANSWPTYGHGWTNRNIAVTQQCLGIANT